MNRLQLTYRGFPPSEALSRRIDELADKLHKAYDRITSCHVTIEQPHRHHAQGRSFHVSVVIEVPGKEIAITRHGTDHENAYAAATEVFKAARRKLREHARVLHGEVKAHSRPEPLARAG